MANSSNTTSNTGTNKINTITTPAQPSAPTQRPAQPAPASLAAVPPPAPHTGIYSVHINIYMQNSKIYSYILQNKKMLARKFLNLYMFVMLTAVRYIIHKQIYIHKQIARIQTIHGELEVEKDKKGRKYYTQYKYNV